MKLKAIFGGLLVAGMCAGNVEAITYHFNEGVERYGTSAETFYSDISLPGWKFDDNMVNRGLTGPSNPLSYNANGGDGFGIIMNIPGLPDGETGEILFNAPVYSATLDVVLNVRANWDDVSTWGYANWSITALDALGNQLDIAQNHVGDFIYWHTLDSLTVESETPIAKVVIWTDKNLGINTLTTSLPVPDGGATAALLVLGLSGFVFMRARH